MTYGASFNATMSDRADASNIEPIIYGEEISILQQFLWDEIMKDFHLEDPPRLGIGGCSIVYRVGNHAWKSRCGPREIALSLRAGDCAVRMIGRVRGSPQMPKGSCLMEIAEPLADFSTICNSEIRSSLKNQMIQLLEELHTKYQIVHGDIKASNILRCKDGKLRFCDFQAARSFQEHPSEWDGLYTLAYMSPNWFRSLRVPGQSEFGPEPIDDWYALALTIWRLYTKKPLVFPEGTDVEDLLKRGKTVDIMEVDDDETREWIRDILKKGGAVDI